MSVISRNSEEMHKQMKILHENFITIKLTDLKEEGLIKEFRVSEENEDFFTIITLEGEEFDAEYLHDNQFTIHNFPKDFNKNVGENIFVSLETLISFISPSYEKTIMNSLFNKLQSVDIRDRSNI